MTPSIRARAAAALLALLATSAALAQATLNPQAAAPPKTSPQPRDFSAAPARAGWWNDAVFYHLFLRSFADASTGPLAGDGIGDFQGLIERLDYLNDGNPATTTDLGVTGLWLMPIHPSPGYHGYEVDDYYAINPQHGSLDDFRRFMKEADRRGIRVILDLVLNHVSWKHPWFVDASTNPQSPYRDWFIWTDTAPAWKGPWNQQVWWRAGSQPGSGLRPVQPGDTDGPFYYGIFYLTMPDLNYRNPEASRAMLDVVRHWIEREGVAGYRLDAIRHLVEEGQVQENTQATHEWLREFHRVYKDAGRAAGLGDGGAFTIGEVWAPSDQVAPYVGDQLDTCFEFDTSYAMVKAARDRDASDLIRVTRRVNELFPPNQFGRFLTNHDQNRIMSELRGDWGAMRVAADLLLLGPGVPFIYYGEEIGMTGVKPDENLRTPMQWSAAPHGGFTTGVPWRPANADADQKNVAAQSAAPGSLLNHYRTLIRLRREHPALAWGRTAVLDSDRPEVFAMLRTADLSEVGRSGTQTVLVVINVGDRGVSDYGLTLPVSDLPRSVELRAREVLQGVVVSPLTTGVDGSVRGYRPIPRLEARSSYVVILE